jgi:hypothetical protein
VELGHRARFPELHIQSQVIGGAAPALASHTVPNTLGLFAWLFKVQLIAALESEIDGLVDPEFALSNAEKAEREPRCAPRS